MGETPDLSFDTLIAVAAINNHSSGYSDPSIPVITFDRTIVNQDLYLTHVDVQSTKPLNYYIEMEAIDISDASAEYYTIRDLRSNV